MIEVPQYFTQEERDETCCCSLTMHITRDKKNDKKPPPLKDLSPNTRDITSMIGWNAGFRLGYHFMVLPPCHNLAGTGSSLHQNPTTDGWERPMTCRYPWFGSPHIVAIAKGRLCDWHWHTKSLHSKSWMAIESESSGKQFNSWHGGFSK